MSWQPIQTAPRDGTVILGYYEHQEYWLPPSMIVMKYFELSGEGGSWGTLPGFELNLLNVAEGIKLFAPWFFPSRRLRKLKKAVDATITGYHPTHWRPLPEPPVQP